MQKFSKGVYGPISQFHYVNIGDCSPMSTNGIRYQRYNGYTYDGGTYYDINTDIDYSINESYCFDLCDADSICTHVVISSKKCYFYNIPATDSYVANF